MPTGHIALSAAFHLLLYKQLLAAALRTNLEAVTKSTMNFLGLFSFIYQYRNNRYEKQRNDA
jgi:hypothetical protein